MAEARLNFNEETLDRESLLYDLYSRLYNGMSDSNTVDAPSYEEPPYKTDADENIIYENGIPVIDSDKIAADLAEYTTIQMKNSAYMLASAIIGTVSGGREEGEGGSEGGGSGSGGGFVLRNGDSMNGKLNALYGFAAGAKNTKIFEVFIDGDEISHAKVTGYLDVDGRVNLGDDGIYFHNNQVLFWQDNKLQLASPNGIFIDSDVEIDEDHEFKLGDILITKNGVYFDNKEYYHSGNANNEDTDWTMYDAYVYGQLHVFGGVSFDGFLSALKGFELGAHDEKLLYSVSEEVLTFPEDSDDPDDAIVSYRNYVALHSDLRIQQGYGIKFTDKYVLKVRQGTNDIVSLCAPGMTLNLGDSDNGVATDHIALQADLYDYSSRNKLISLDGTGNFPNGFSAGYANGGNTVLQTFRLGDDDWGFTANGKLSFGEAGGPRFFSDIKTELHGAIPYIHLEDGAAAAQTDMIGFKWYYAQTNSLWRNLSLAWSASLHFDTDGEFIVFDKPVEGQSFAIASEHYKTMLAENVLYFGDAIFLEGLPDGIRHAGNAYFDDNLSSPTFASGFAGYGWAIMEDELYGGIGATFDELTIRKKMRVYELEVQKISVTNGSLWVSDSCSGDEVEIIYDRDGTI